MAFTGTASLPMWGASGAFGGAPLFWAGQCTLPMRSASGSFSLAFYAWTGETVVPLRTTDGAFIGSVLWSGETDLPMRQTAGEFAAGSVFAGSAERPLWEALGALGAQPFRGSVTLPLWVAQGRLEGAVSATFRGWPVNLKNKALTEYTDYPFNSFARFNGEYLGASDSGIFALSGTDDAGEYIDARVRLALSDLGVETLKRVSEVFLSYRSVGTLILRVVVDGGLTYEYPLEPTGKTGVYQTRVKTGQGLKVNYLCFELVNVEGSAFDLDAVRVRPILLSRSIGGN